MEIKIKTKQVCPCGGTFIPTDDFFIWGCDSCKKKWAIQMSPYDVESEDSE